MWQTKKVAPRSPIKEPLARLPGQSLDEERHRLIEDVVWPSFRFAAMAWFIALVEWCLELTKSPRRPGLFTVCAAIATIVVAYRIRRLLPKLRQLKLGREGERAVAQELDHLKADGYRVVHDVVALGFNLDHVLVGRQGIFLIETKTWSKRGRDPHITVKAGQVFNAGVLASDNPIDQAMAEADWLRGLLFRSTARQFTVKAVVLFPGWYVEPMDSPTKAKAWVLNPKNLRAFLVNEPELLSDSDVAMVVDRLQQHAKTER